jgi:hypothetical protein
MARQQFSQSTGNHNQPKNGQNSNENSHIIPAPEHTLSEAARQHMHLIGTFLVEIVREWNERHPRGESAEETLFGQEPQ